MSPIQILAALASAALHAGWNAAVKASPSPTRTMTAQMVGSALIVLPGLALTGLPARPAWIWIASSTALNLVTVTALLRAYALAGFGVVYPLVRALSVLLVVPLAAVIAGESLSPFGLIGVGLVAAALLVIAIDRRERDAVPRKALGWTFAAGVATAAYVMCDAQGVRLAGSPLSYGFAVSITNAAAMLWKQSHAPSSDRKEVSPIAPRHVAAALPIAAAAVISYLLILWVWSTAPIAPASALRDTSAVFAILIAVLWLKEPFTRTRLLAILMSAAAVPLLRLA
jgi:drug/metabolite transporter (DMT)-like permease